MQLLAAMTKTLAGQNLNSFPSYLIFNVVALLCVLLCLDCGATNVRAMVVDEKSVIVGKASQPNATLLSQESVPCMERRPDSSTGFPNAPSRRSRTCRTRTVKAVAITTFGVDSALTDLEGGMAPPSFPWKCPRTADVMKHTHGPFPADPDGFP